MTMKKFEDKTWKELADEVLLMMTGEKSIPTNEDEITAMNVAFETKAKELGIDSTLPFSKKVLNLNILDKKVNFKVLELFPALWKTVYATSMDYVTSELRSLSKK